jgi:hypothetical protein
MEDNNNNNKTRLLQSWNSQGHVLGSNSGEMEGILSNAKRMCRAKMDGFCFFRGASHSNGKFNASIKIIKMAFTLVIDSHGGGISLVCCSFSIW